MRAGVVDVAQVIFVALAADRPEALVHDHLGKADDRVERRADFVTDLRQEIRFDGARALRLFARQRASCSACFEALVSRMIAQNLDSRSHRRCGRGQEDGNCSARPRKSRHFAPAIEMLGAPPPSTRRDNRSRGARLSAAMRIVNGSPAISFY